MSKSSRQNRGSRRSFTPSSPRGYKADLNKLFDTGKVPDRFKSLLSEGGEGSSQGTERQKLIRAARGAETPAAFNKAVAALVEQFTLPGDQPILMRALDHDDSKVVIAALEGLMELDDRHPLTKRKVLKIRLDTLEQVSRDIAVLDMIEMLRARL
jgi:hypothetical protein